MHPMSTTVADQVYARVTALTGADPGMTRASAIRAVSAEMGRSVPATSSAFYAGAKRAEAAAAASAPTRGRRTAVAGHPDAPALYAKMLPLIEAGATVEQAARRFGDEETVIEIAAGFSRWRACNGGSPQSARGDAARSRVLPDGWGTWSRGSPARSTVLAPRSVRKSTDDGGPRVRSCDARNEPAPPPSAGRAQRREALQ